VTPASAFPAGTRVRIDSSVRRYGDGRLVLGGAPLRLLRLSARGAHLLDSWAADTPIGAADAETRLARRLVDAGVLHPKAEGGTGFSVCDVTLIVPVKDNAEGVAQLLAGASELGDRIVVDDGSGTPIPGAHIRHHTARGPAAARNAGARRATTDLIAFLDSDTAPDPHWLHAVLPLFGDPAVAAVAPRIRSLPDGPLGAYEADRGSLDMGPRPAVVQPGGRVRYVPSAALVVRRAALSTVGGFDETLRYGEDVDLVWRLMAGGKIVRYQPDSIVWHHPRDTLRAWLRQRFDYGTSAAPLARRHPGRLHCAVGSPAAAGWGLAIAGHPAAGLSAAAIEASVSAWRLRRTGLPLSAAVAVSARALLRTGPHLAEAVRRAWWPILAIVTGRRRRYVLGAAVLPIIAETLLRRRGPRWAALRLADDLAYGLGVWSGCLRHRTAAPLLPRLTAIRGRAR